MTQEEQARIAKEKADKQRAVLPGTNTLLMGPAGTGKTHAIGTIVDLGFEVFYFAFEAGSESLLGYWTDRGLPVPSNLHIITVKAASASWLDMAGSVQSVNKLAYESLKKMTDPKRGQYNQFEIFLRSFNDVTDDDGNKYGCIDSFGPGKVVVIDGLTGLSDACMKTVVGGKADRDMKDWGLAQNLLENFLRKITSDCQFHFILLSHVEREVDQVLGGVKLMVSTLGKALPPKLPSMFSDVILAVRKVDKWYWDTASALADVKTRNLPISNTNAPTFKTIIDKWKSRGGEFEVATK